ncbi:GSCOCT00005313001.2-RA-CDS [Cotesia congregata]|uniref:Venom protein 90-9 n=1 Tax=Cotesia congregata TaxID=51543 RepID=A0A8J2MD07_COTCN|nr:GSCOCT00005313001.2-RA-CDS [Cotesia congregata]CAG5084229.1 Venom protein 90-9 [Cotesia congregata]
MRSFVALIIVSIYAVDFTSGCWSRPTAALPPEFFLIDYKTPVYFYGRGSNHKRTLASIHEETHIKHMKFNKNNRDIKPYMIFLRTIVVVDYSMYQRLNLQVLDHVMASMYYTENQANKVYEYPQLKFVVTAIVIPTDNVVLSSFKPDSKSYLNTSPRLFNEMRQFLLGLKKYKTGMKYDFAIFISSAKSVYNEDINQLRKVTSNGYPSCLDDSSPPKIQSVITVVDEVPNSDYSPVYGEIVKLIEYLSNHFMCSKNFIKYNEEFVPDAAYDACTNTNLKNGFSAGFPECYYDMPEFLKN